MKRVKVKFKKPNPLFELWLEEWKKEAASKNSELQHHFAKALTSLKKYPLPLKSGKDCIILQHFGMKLCLMLDKKLEKHKAEKKSLSTDDLACLYYDHDKEYLLKRKSKLQQIKGDINDGHEKTELAAFDKLNLLSWEIQNYAALLILYKKTQDPCSLEFTTEDELICEVKELCSYASEISVVKLLDNGLISTIDEPLRYSLTEYGKSIAKLICETTIIDAKLINSFDTLKKIRSCLTSLITNSSDNLNNRDKNEETPKKYKENTQNHLDKSLPIQRSQSVEGITTEKIEQQADKCFIKQKYDENIHMEKYQEKSKKARNVNKCTQNGKGASKTGPTDDLEQETHLKSNEFDIILLVDTQEISGGKTKPQHDATLVELSQLDILFEVRHLKVGDFAWVARCRITNKELILPYVVERKRIDDLSASITDGRFHEQKFRLKQSGIENLMYIIEECNKSQRLTVPHSSLMQASINTLIQDGFLIKYTIDHKDSMFYLSSLTKILTKLFKEKNLIGSKKEALGKIDILSNTVNLMEFEKFNKASSKQKVYKVSEMFLRQLLQLKGLSVDKAFAIVERYPTPQILVDALQNSDNNGELLLASIEFGDKKRQLGPAISKTIYQLYTQKNLN